MKPGDWAFVWGQVVADSTATGDMVVRFQSHNEEYEALVRADYVTEANAAPRFAPKCTHLLDLGAGGYARCSLNDKHGGMHRDASGQQEWADGDTSGWIEEDAPKAVQIEQ